VRLVLASRSPRRAELLRGLRLPFEVMPADVDESPLPGESADAYVERLARTKAEAVRARIAADDVLVLGADTTVELDGRILGKPEDQADGVAMLLALAGRSHRVATGIAVAGPGRTESVCVTAEVEFRDVDRAEAEAYWATGEPADKAGGYGLQGIGGIFVASIRGSASAVVGLPVAETEQLLRRCGMDTWHERLQG
jgi:septum formation protein